MQGKSKILVIDDEKVILDSVVKLCSAEGWQVDAAIDVAEALKKIDRNQYHLFVCDIMMPEIDGFEFLDILKEKSIKTPVVITTGYSTVENAVKSLNQGAIDFLPKPFTMDELVGSIYRGLKFAALTGATDQTDSEASDSADYVPCPQEYLRLGYATWCIMKEDGSLKIGVTDLLLKTIGDIAEVELMDLDNEVIQGNYCAQIITKDGLRHYIQAPMSGRIIDRNQEIIDNNELLEKDPYFEGWFYIIIPSDPDYESRHLVTCN